MTMLNSKAIKHLIETQQIVTDYIDLDKQLQPAGFDLSLKEIHEFLEAGAVDFDNKKRRIAPLRQFKPDTDGWYNLPQGCYMIIYNEVVKMPLNVVALARSRSTVLRNAAAIETAVWDPGYQGRSSSLLVVHNPHGIRLEQNARVAQLIFYSTNEVEKGYSGIYQNERIT
jgi:dUTP pyrophosphatase